MLTKSSKTFDEDLPKDRMLTEEEDCEIKGNLARRNFGMNLDEFTEAWKAGKFDNDRKRHGDVVFLAKMLPEYWVEWLLTEARQMLSITTDRASKELSRV